MGIVDNPLNLTFEFLLKYLAYIRRRTSLEILELIVFIYFLIAMFVFKPTGFIPEKRSMGGFCGSNAPIQGF